MEYPITYLYTLTSDNKIFYIGKTRTPKSRFTSHYNKIKEPFIMEIIRGYIDEEDKTIIDYYKKGLINIQIPRNTEGLFSEGFKLNSNNVGSISKKVFDNKLNKTWDTISECSKYYNIGYQTISNHLKGNNTKQNSILDLKYA